AAQTPLKELGNHPEDEKPVAIFEGRYGPYVKWNKLNATIPKETEIDSVTLEKAVEWLEEKAKKKGIKKKSAKKSAPKTSAKKKSAKKKKPS
ncbi:MAG: hypothetical protein KDA80_07415, partial [Planctomycetaceae bacterium]|nr:hypothetical protein [Planctomycetaceae bacterium]